VRIRPDSLPFTLLLGLLSSLPTFGIDMILTTLSATGADLGAPPSDVGLAMSVYLLGLGAALLVWGPLSDRFGRKPIVVFGCAILTLASIGCICARSLPRLLAFRQSRAQEPRAREWPLSLWSVTCPMGRLRARRCPIWSLP
jgi:MFS transporter, DHA1 family, multidrug resistance protein